jgi:FkbM family methyltransferase
MNLASNSIVRRFFNRAFNLPYNVSYSQAGEDLILELFFEARQIIDIRYLDIGCNHPVKFNNTFKLYENGHTGICVEPDPTVVKLIEKKRSRDLCLNVGLAGQTFGDIPFFVMNNSVMNTFSEVEAKSMESNGIFQIEEVIRIPVIGISDFMTQYFSDSVPTFVNIDVEGLDLEIISNFPFDRYRPSCFCIETVDFTLNASAKKREYIFEVMELNNYKVFADTYINTIFVDCI